MRELEQLTPDECALVTGGLLDTTVVLANQQNFSSVRQGALAINAFTLGGEAEATNVAGVRQSNTIIAVA